MYQPSARFNAAVSASRPSGNNSQASADNHFALGQHFNKDAQDNLLAESEINELSSDSTPQTGDNTASESRPRTSAESQSVDLKDLPGNMGLLEEDDGLIDDSSCALLDYDDFPSPPVASAPLVGGRSSSRHSDATAVSPSSSPPEVVIVHGGSYSKPQAPIVPKRGDSRPASSQPAKMSNEASQFGIHNAASSEDVFRTSSHVLEDDYDYNSTDEEEQVLATGHDHEQQLAQATSPVSLRRRSTERAPPRGVAESHLPPTPPHSTQDSVLNTRKANATRSSTTSSAAAGSPLRQRAGTGEDKNKYFPAAALSSDIYKTSEKRNDNSARTPTVLVVDRKRSVATDHQSDKASNKVEVDMQWSVQKLLNEDVFTKVVNDPQGRHQFRTFLEKEGTEGLLDFYCDMTGFESQYEGRKQITEAIFASYASDDADVRVDLPNEMHEDLYTTLRQSLEIKAAFSPMLEHVRVGLYKDQFQRFIKSMLIDQYREKLGNLESSENYSGLSDCFCLTNPRAGTENPIVLASEGFLAVTGYTRQEVLGRNCRFLQGPATSPDAIDRIRDALNGGKGCMELMLNYQKDGTPFFCLLSIIPLRDARGQLAYFIGGQCNVSETLASGKTLEYLMGKNSEHTAKVHTHAASGTELSPTLARYFAGHHLKTGGLSFNDNRSVGSSTRDSDWSRSNKTGRKAAGSYDPSKLRGPCGAPLLAGALADGSASANNGLLARITGRSSNGKSGQDIPDLRPTPSPTSSSAPAPRQLTGQRLLGAEDLLRQAPASTLKDQLWLFTNLYSRIIIFKRHKREVIFVTAPLLEALGLPCATDADRYDSGLLHCDVLSLLQGATKNETRVLRQAVQDAIHSGKPISVMTGLRRRPAKTGVSKLLAESSVEAASDRVIKYTALHVTPLYDRDDATFAFVAVLG